MQLLRGDSHFTAQPKFTTVSEASGDIDVYRGAVYLVDEALRAVGVLRDYRIAVVRGVLPNMGNCGIKTVDNCNCENIVKKFGIEVGGGGRACRRLFARQRGQDAAQQEPDRRRGGRPQELFSAWEGTLPQPLYVQGRPPLRCIRRGGWSWR